MDELNRKLVHISGLLFVVLAQLTGRWMAAFYFLTIATTLLIYSEHVRREKRRFSRLVERIERDFRKAVLRMERPDAARPFAGAFWLFFGCGIAFALFPLPVASAA